MTGSDFSIGMDVIPFNRNGQLEKVKGKMRFGQVEYEIPSRLLDMWI